MKKFILLVIICFFVCACKAPVMYIGMSTKDFVSNNNGIEVVEASTERTVYKKTNHPFAAPKKITFFYFVNDKLVRMDQGVYRPDIIIEQNIK